MGTSADMLSQVLPFVTLLAAMFVPTIATAPSGAASSACVSAVSAAPC